MALHRAPLALTMGEPGGVAAEITRAAWRTLRDSGPAFFLIGDPGLAAAADGSDIAIIDDPRETHAVFEKALPVLRLSAAVTARAGSADPANAPAVIESIERATALALCGDARALVTNPIQKSSLMAAGFRFPGHTEFLEDLTNHAPMPQDALRGAVMMLASPMLKTIPVTIHQSVRDAIATLSSERIVYTARIVHHALRRYFDIAHPRIAVSGLNPHAGESGALGLEDGLVIDPAVKQLQDEGVRAFGPLPADTMFHAEARERYDAALCMLHDQALIPVKTLAFHDGVNVTLGLPVIRTSPDHGTALDIAGAGAARPDSLIAAIRLASAMADASAKK